MSSEVSQNQGKGGVKKETSCCSETTIKRTEAPEKPVDEATIAGLDARMKASASKKPKKGCCCSK